MFHYDGFIVSTMEDMRAHGRKGVSATVSMIDARNVERFTGEEKDPRGLRTGHIPGAINIPSQNFLNMPDNTFKSTDEIIKVLD
mmetsp:Transcript_37983/g.34020  ORF Transcript_37983/g.34020 Transcript_37983/m.34020 type:complete len:84 (+) Transcript_37983:527-778(+)